MLAMPAIFEYSAGMGQYTIRGISTDLDRAIRKRATERQISVNQASLDLLRHGLEQEFQNHDLDFVQGSWVSEESADAEFDSALNDQRRIDAGLWKSEKPTGKR